MSAETAGNKNDKIIWTQEMTEAFHKLKEIIAEEIKLAYPDYREGAEALELHVDASGYGAGACLAQ